MTEPEPQNELDAVLDWALDRYPHEIIPALQELDALRDERKNVDALVEMLRVARTDRDRYREALEADEQRLGKLIRMMVPCYKVPDHPDMVGYIFPDDETIFARVSGLTLEDLRSYLDGLFPQG